MIKRNFPFERHTQRAARTRGFTVLTLAMGASAIIACGDGDGGTEPDIQTDTDPLEETPRRMRMEDDTMVPPPQAEPEPEPSMPVDQVPGGATPNGLSLPADFRDWRVIGVADPAPTDTADTIRVIVGNDTAVAAARAGNTNPWPDGSMIAHYVWAAAAHETAADSIAPGNFGALTLMVKDSEAYAEDGGWAYGLWAGPELLSPGTSDFDRACVDCHTQNVADNDYVFTQPGELPSAATVALAEPALSTVFLPADILDWRVIGVVNRVDNSTIRVIVGNDIAVEAARAAGGTEVQRWPDESKIAHYVWAYGENPNAPGVVAPGDFAAITLMEKREEAYSGGPGWRYGFWSGADLERDDDPTSEQACVDCHTSSVRNRDYVFTTPGALPPL